MKIKLHLIVFSCLAVFFSCKTEKDLISTLPTISSISLDGIQVLKADISEAQKKITLLVPYQSNLISVVPIIKTQNASEVIPAVTVPQNFTRVVYYTLVSQSGEKVIYEVNVISNEQPLPEITSIDKDTIEAGATIEVFGKYFGLNPTEVQASISDGSTATPLKTELIDSLHVRVSSQDNLLPGKYFLALRVKNKTTEYNQPIQVEYPTPSIDSLDYLDVIQEENMKVFGKYFSKNYEYQLKLTGSGVASVSIPASINNNTLLCKVPTTIKEGNYQIKVINSSLKKESSTFAQSITVYSKDMPYLIDSEKVSETTLKAGTNVGFTTSNFEKIPARFYQIQLESNNNSFVQNALYSPANKRLSFEVPQTKGKYSISLILSNETTILYQIKTRFVLAIE